MGISHTHRVMFVLVAAPRPRRVGQLAKLRRGLHIWVLRIPHLEGAVVVPQSDVAAVWVPRRAAESLPRCLEGWGVTQKSERKMKHGMSTTSS